MRLFLLQPEVAAAAACLAQWQMLCQAQDGTVFMGETVLALTKSNLPLPQNCYCLALEAHLLNPELQPYIQVIDYDILAQLLLEYQQQLTLK